MKAPSTTRESPRARSALRQRLRTAARALTESGVEVDDTDQLDTGALLDGLVRSVHEDLSSDRMWLLWTALASAFPNSDEVLEALRYFELANARESTMWLLTRCLRSARWNGSPALDMRLVERSVVVDVDHSARHDLHTGIQRVVRTTVPAWNREHAMVPVAWTANRGAFRTLDDDEHRRVFEWIDDPSQVLDDAAAVADPNDGQLVVPWKSVVALVEVPAKDTCDALAALAQLSGNDVVAIGYDCIPIVSADMVPILEPNRFVRYLTVVKHARRVAAISSSATQEFQGFADMLPLQGVAGPTVVECALPADVTTASRTPRSVGEPSIVCVGSFEPRKNQNAVLYAAESLWREGLRFRVRFIGSGGSDSHFARRLRHLQAIGRPVTTESAVSEAELVEAYREARFSVFVSTHEGYGLPVAESLAFGTPVITGDYGSTREISRDGGAVLVNPRDDDALVAAMRELLLDDDRLQELLTDIDARPARSWDDYARELWGALVDPVADPASTRPGSETVTR